MPVLRFSVVRTRRQGMKLSDAELQRQEPVIGELQCCIQDDAHLRRAIRVARPTRTVDALRPELIPALYDADIITLGRTGAVITGIERLGSDRGVVEFAQSWWVRFL